MTMGAAVAKPDSIIPGAAEDGDISVAVAIVVAIVVAVAVAVAVIASVVFDSISDRTIVSKSRSFRLHESNDRV
jgi:hypothetical protein